MATTRALDQSGEEERIRSALICASTAVDDADSDSSAATSSRHRDRTASDQLRMLATVAVAVLGGEAPGR